MEYRTGSHSKTSYRLNRLVYQVVMGVCLALLLGPVKGQAQIMPAAGTRIGNQATAHYLDVESGFYETLHSNRVNLVVLPLEALVLTVDQQVQAPPGGVVFLPHRLTNTGNLHTAYTLTLSNRSGDDYDLLNLQVVNDVNGDGIANSGEPVVPAGESVWLDPDESFNLVVVGVIPSDGVTGQVAAIEVVATSMGQGATATNIDRINIVDGAAIQLAKLASDLAPGPNDEVVFTLSGTNSGTKPALEIPFLLDGRPIKKVVLRDLIPANTQFVEVVDSAGAMVLYHQLNDPLPSYVSTPPANLRQVDAIAFGLSQLNPTSGRFSVSFKVKIHSNASGTISNVATISYDDGVAVEPVTINSNTVWLVLPTSIPTIRYFRDDRYNILASVTTLGTPLFVRADASQCNVDPTQIDTTTIVISSQLTGDVESFLAIESEPNSGAFLVLPNVPTANANEQPVEVGNGVIETLKNDALTATLVGCGVDVEVKATILIDPYGVVFNSQTNEGVAGVTVALIDVTGEGNGGNPGGPAAVFEVDGLTPWPSRVTTQERGEYQFPLVAPSQYRLVVTPPADFTFPSVVPPDRLPGERIIDVAGSYGEPFEVAGSGGPVQIDIPLDARVVGTLFLEKQASLGVVEIGDFVEYQIDIRNATNSTLGGIVVNDTLPEGFSYISGTTYLDSIRVADPEGGSGPPLAFQIGSMRPAEELTLTYRVRVGPGAWRSEGINRAQAASASPLVKLSNLATYSVRVDGGVFTDRGYIMGKVFLDCNGNGMQDAREDIGIPGIRLYLEDGTFVITDREGKYTIYGINPGTHVLKLDYMTLPAGAGLFAMDTRHAGDPASRFVDLKNGELHRADFAVCAPTPEVLQNIRARREQAADAAAEIKYSLETPMPVDGSRRPGGNPRSLPASGFVTGTGIPTYASKATTPNKRAGTAIEPVKAGQIELEALLPNLDNTLGFIGLEDRDTLSLAQTNVRVKGVSGGQFRLWVNGDEVAQSRIGKRVVVAEKQIQAWEYIGINLKPGENTLQIEQLDGFGNQRGSERIRVIAPGNLAQIKILVEEAELPIDGTPARIRVRLEDAQGVLVTGRIPLTLEASLGEWAVADLDNTEPGTQVFVEEGLAEYLLMPPPETGDSRIRISSGTLQSETVISFLPNLRPLLAAGVIEGVFNLRDLGGTGGVPAGEQDGFEREIKALSWTSSDDKYQAGGRAALFLKGKIKGSYLLTMGYDSEKDPRQRLFRDIQPDEFYPVYGESSVRGFDAQSTGRLYVRVDRKKSYLLYGDYSTYSNNEARSLSVYNRSLTGTRGQIETHYVQISGFANHDNDRQIIEELPARGISGPYTLRNRNFLLNSEIVEIITRDRYQPELILSTERQTRFLDYMVEIPTGNILFSRPIPSLDEHLNPISIRVTYEVEQGGSDFWIRGVDGRLGTDQIKVGGTFVDDQNPQNPFRLAGANLSLKLGSRTQIIGDVARTENEETGKGEGAKVELRHENRWLRAHLYGGRTDERFFNPSARLGTGRLEAGFKGALKVTSNTRIRGEGIRTEDVVTHNKRQGVLVSLEQGFGKNLRLELGMRHASESKGSALASGRDTTAVENTTIRGKIAGPMPAISQLSLYGEYEQEIHDASKRIAAVGGDYRFFSRSRLYARHEFISSFRGPYALSAFQSQHTTLVGLDTDYLDNMGRIFSEYRARDAFAGREAQAAIGLRNRWPIAPGLVLNTSLERVMAVSGKAPTEGTAVTGALEFRVHPLWKGTVRAEVRDSERNNRFLNTFGLAGKLHRNWTLLWRNILDMTDFKDPAVSSRFRNRMRLGLAYRDTDTNLLHGLARYELRYEQANNPNGIRLENWVQLFSLHLNYRPVKPLVLMSQYAGKWVEDDVGGLGSHFDAHLFSGRATLELGRRVDLGVLASTLFSGDLSSKRYGLGGELGVRLMKNLWLSAGYNFFGFRDKDLAGVDYTNPGAYARLRLKFDEYWLNRLLPVGDRPKRGYPICPPGTPGCPEEPSEVEPVLSKTVTVEPPPAYFWVERTVRRTTARVNEQETTSFDVVFKVQVLGLSAAETLTVVPTTVAGYTLSRADTAQVLFLVPGGSTVYRLIGAEPALPELPAPEVWYRAGGAETAAEPVILDLRLVGEEEDPASTRRRELWMAELPGVATGSQRGPWAGAKLRYDLRVLAPEGGELVDVLPAGVTPLAVGDLGEVVGDTVRWRLPVPTKPETLSLQTRVEVDPSHAGELKNHAVLWTMADLVDTTEIDTSRGVQRVLVPSREDSTLVSILPRPSWVVTAVTTPETLYTEVARQKIFQLGAHSFASGKDILTARARAALRELMERLADFPDQPILVSGHTDSVPIHTRRFPNNQVLSLARSAAVKTWLVAAGVDSSRIITRGYGPTRPVDTNQMAAGRRRNRRVEIDLLSTEIDRVPFAVTLTRTTTVTYKGNEPVLRMQLTDSLTSDMAYMPGSAANPPLLGEQALIWTWQNVQPGASFAVTYQLKVVGETTGATALPIRSVVSYSLPDGQWVSTPAVTGKPSVVIPVLEEVKQGGGP